MRAVVLSVGSELLRGDILDTNARFLTRRLSELGFEVQRVVQVGDDLRALTATVTEGLQSADLIVCSGGLGPTQDDLTRDAIAAALGEEMFLDEALITDIAARFASLHRPMTDNNRRQALRISSAEALPNPNGTAPGWFVRRDGRLIVTLPGPPRELEPMWNEQAEPRLPRLEPGARATLALITFGLGESMLEHRIADLIQQHPDVTVATYAKSAGVEVHITARAETEARARGRRDEMERLLRERLEDHVFGTGNDTLSHVVGRMLLERGMTLAVMESVTGGDLADLVTDVGGSSRYFLGGIVAYTRAMKEKSGVPTGVLDTYGAVSPETALAMARAARTSTGASAAISTTGIAGGEDLEGRAAGTCFVAVSLGDGDEVREVHRRVQRDLAKRYFAQCALDLLRRQLLVKQPVTP